MNKHTTKQDEATKYLKGFFSYMRPHGSDAERDWIATYITPQLPAGKHFTDEVGNIHVDLRSSKRKGKARTLFVAHTDTVHRNDGRQFVDIKDNVLSVVVNEGAVPAQPNCLGADDGAGVIVLLNLIERGVPAYYIFTRCEERGGLGARHLVDKYAMLLAQFDRAIAFDRKGTSSVITHQGYGRCCSNAFADALSNELSDLNLMYAPDDTGVYTDTAEFVDIIPECTNISVGYFNEHTTHETLDLAHLKQLIYRVAAIDWEALPVERDPTVREKPEWYGNRYVGASDGLVKYNSVLTDYAARILGAIALAREGSPEDLLWEISDAYEGMGDGVPDSVYPLLCEYDIDPRVLTWLEWVVEDAFDDREVEEALIDACYEIMDDAKDNDNAN